MTNKKGIKKEALKKYAQNSIIMILETVNLYKIEMYKAFENIPNLTVLNCFAVCTLALDFTRGVWNQTRNTCCFQKFL